MAFNNTLINNPRVKDEITKLIRRQLAPHENENPARRKFGKHRSQRFRDGAEPCSSGGRSPVGAPRSRFTHRRERTGWARARAGPPSVLASGSRDGCTGSGFASVFRAGRRENGALPARPSPSVREGAPPGRRPRGPRCVVTAGRVHGRAGEGCAGTAPWASLRRGPRRRRHPRNRERHTALRGSRHHAPATERTSHFRSDCEGGTLGATP